MAGAHVILKLNQIKLKGGCQLGKKVVPHNSKSDLPLVTCHKVKAVNLQRCVLYA